MLSAVSGQCLGYAAKKLLT